MLGVFFIDVGGAGPQGDAILIKKGDLDILVDAGPAESSGKVVDFLRSHDVDDIEVLISTNADPRHYGGINAVLENFLVEELWWTDDSFGDPDYSAAIERVSDQAKDVRVVRDGFTAELNGINLTAINPPKEDRDRFDDVNNDAIVMRVQDRNFSMLLTSGIQTGAQGLLLNTRKSLMAAEIVQAPYYGVGSGTSNIGIFLINLKPKIIIISGSSDESAQNGGSRDPFKRQMGMYNITYYENYKNGTLRVTSDGSSYIIQSLGRGQ
jgi:competence protein ComEC